MPRLIRSGWLISSSLIGWMLIGCRPSDVLSVPPPAGVTAGGTLQSQSGAEGVFFGGKAGVFQAFAYGGLVPVVELGGTLTDEFTWSNFSTNSNEANLDARFTAAYTPTYSNGQVFQEEGDQALAVLLGNRSQLLVAEGYLARFEPASGRSKVGEAYALIAYAELLLAETYCGGVPLSYTLPAGGFVYGAPLTTDSLLGTAEAHFDSALKYAAGSDTVIALASVGLGRTRLDRGRYADAASAVANVPTGFIYNVDMETSFSQGAPGQFNVWVYQTLLQGCGFMTVSDREGINGLNFVSARDPRMPIDSVTYKTCDGGTWYYPLKFGEPSSDIPMATGVEARLIEAEAALHAGQVNTWASDLDALRADAGDTKVTFPPANLALTADSTTTASAAMRVDVMFRERAFWLFGTGTRLGDLRRLIRQYGRAQNTVFPTGPYPNGANTNLPHPLPDYGTDVNITLPLPDNSGNPTTNPNVHGCLTPTSTA